MSVVLPPPRYTSDDAHEDAWYAAKVVLPSGRKQPVDEQKQPLLNALRGYVNRQCRITLIDGRVVLVSFICYDYQVPSIHMQDEKR